MRTKDFLSSRQSCEEPLALYLWLNTVRGGLERLRAYDPGFNSQDWPSNLGQNHVHVFLEQERLFDGVLYNL